MALPPPPCRHRRRCRYWWRSSWRRSSSVSLRMSLLVRAALVCKLWRRIILSHTGFLYCYHAFHRRRPPLLGFFCNEWLDDVRRPSFVPIGAAFPSLHRRRAWRILDCRHGRVLVKDAQDGTSKIIVWDPISDDWQELYLPEEHNFHCRSYCLAVLCAIAGCDHLDCRGGPFLVVYLGADDYIDDPILNACVYTSETHAWGMPVSYELDRGCDFNIQRCATVMGDEIYCIFTPGINIVKYDFVKRSISLLISLPSRCSHNLPAIVGVPWVLRQTEDGQLGLARIRDSRLYLWSSRMVNHDGKLVVEWIQERVIELGEILPIEMNKHSAKIHVSGFADGVGILFISTHIGTFTFELKSGRVRKITASRDFKAFPFISYFTPSEQWDILQPQLNLL